MYDPCCCIYGHICDIQQLTTRGVIHFGTGPNLDTLTREGDYYRYGAEICRNDEVSFKYKPVTDENINNSDHTYNDDYHYKTAKTLIMIIYRHNPKRNNSELFFIMLPITARISIIC